MALKFMESIVNCI